MEINENQYSNGEITVTYNPTKCIHAEKCASELSEVFRTTVIPWINLEGAETKKVVKQVRKCPSGALQCRYNRKKSKAG